MADLVKLAEHIFLFNKCDDFFRQFVTSTKLEPVSEVVMQSTNSASDFYGIEFLPSGNKKVLRDSSFGDVVCSDVYWEHIDFFPSANANPHKAVLLSAIYSRLCFENVLLCHASLIDYNGHGILFVGPSGIGKTTQAELWHKYRNATIINGDKAFLKMENDKLVGYGLPWKGSSEYCLNSDVNLNAVIVLRQDNENNIRRLNGEKKLSLFAPHIFLPHWDEKCMESALETLDKVLNTVPVYLLKCRPDEESVKLTEATILG